jgi:hypothetical protein
VILDNDDHLDEAGAGGQAKGASGKVDTGRIKLDASLYNTFATSELASAPTETIDASALWYESASGLGPCKQYGEPSAPAQAQPQTLS